MRTRVTMSINVVFSPFTHKDGPFPHYIFTLYTAPVVLLERRLTEEDDDEVVAEGERQSLFSFRFLSKNTSAFSLRS